MAAPTDGDFDIYGEDEGFDVAQQHIDEVRLFPCVPFSLSFSRVAHIRQELESLEDFAEGEKVSTLTSTVEPSTGDKRPREDDLEQHHGNQSLASHSPQRAVGSTANVAYASTMNNLLNPGGHGQGYDALYIGDLQWVCVSLSQFQVSCEVLRGFSGPPMRICVKLRLTSVSRSTIRTSHSLSTKLTGRVKGMVLSSHVSLYRLSR